MMRSVFPYRRVSPQSQLIQEHNCAKCGKPLQVVFGTPPQTKAYHAACYQQGKLPTDHVEHTNC